MKIKIIYIIIILLIQNGLSGKNIEKVTKIRHKGLNNTEESTVKYFMKNNIGALFSNEFWQMEKNALMDLDIFANVDLQMEESPEGIILTYSYKELPSLIVHPAMKRTDQDGLLIGPGISFLNLFGKGIHQEFLSRVTIAPELLRAKELLSYTRIPDVYGLSFDTEFTVNYFKSFNALKLFDENSLYSQAEFTYRLKQHFRIIGSLSSLNIRHDPNVTTFTAQRNIMRMFEGDGQWDFLPAAGIGLAIDTRERMMNPHSGVYSEIKFSQFGRKLGGDGDYSEYTYDLRVYIPAGLKHIIHVNTLGRYRPGTVPSYELFHAGGINSLRTFEADPELCGQHEILATAEYRYEFFANRQIKIFEMNGHYGLQFVLGVDNAWEWLPDQTFRFGRYYNSVYTGIHLLIPALERLRLEFGFNSFDVEEKTIKFGLSCGWFEKASTQRRRVR